MLQNGHQALLDAADELQAGVEVLWFQQAHAGGQVSALQQRLLWGQHRDETVRAGRLDRKSVV